MTRWQDPDRDGQWCFTLAAHPCDENDEFCIKNETFCIKSHKNEEFCIENNEFCSGTTFTLEFIEVPAGSSSTGQPQLQACACGVIEGEECFVEKIYVQTRAGFVVGE